jgi:dimethylamine---corrinoid protein Co-methyltransferase
MGGLRAAGDLVARVQLTRRMRLPQAKAYVAERLGVQPADLSDPVMMADVRRELGLGTIPSEDTATQDDALAIEAKVNIARLLDVQVRSVERFEERTRVRDARPV